MSRMKRGEKGHEEATRKWRESMLARFGSEEALRRHLQGMGRSGGKKSTGGGFASNRQLAREAGRKGGMMHAARGTSEDYGYEKIWAEHGAEITAKYESRTHSAQQLAEEYGMPASSIRYRIRRDA